MTPIQEVRTAEIAVRNIGGIDDVEVTLNEGVNVLAGENATNRTSLLRALSGALGSENLTLKGDADSGWIELTKDGETYRREVTREDGSVSFSGDAYLDGDKVDFADAFAFLFERNKARAAIRQGDDLYDIIMGPVDTAAIQRQISERKSQREKTKQRIQSIESKQSDLPDLYEQRDTLESDISQLEQDIESTNADIEAAESSVEESKDRQESVESKLDELRSKQTELSRVNGNIETTEQTLASLRDDIETKEDELTEITVDETRLSELDAEIDSTYERISNKESMMNELQNIIQFNREMIDDDAIDGGLADVLQPDDTQTETVTDQLVGDDQEVVCWTCGEQTQQSNITEMVTRLKAIHEDLFGERRQLRERVEQLEETKETIAEARKRRDRLESEIETATQEIEQHERNLEQFQRKRDALAEEIGTLEDEVQQLQESQNDRILELQQQVSELEYEKQQKASELATVTERIESIRDEKSELEPLRGELAEIESELSELRARVDQIEQRTVEEFNDRMDEVLNVLDYENIERVWIERKEVEKRDGRQTVTRKRFDLHVVRTSGDGMAYEDTVENLSESEREVTGLVFALAGYLVHKLHDDVPFMILDSLEAIDSARIARLIDYFEDFVPNIAVALLPEDASALSDAYHTVAPAETPTH
jgi:DNA repair exonuclease SbcCD ATPase subunit